MTRASTADGKVCVDFQQRRLIPTFDDGHPASPDTFEARKLEYDCPPTSKPKKKANQHKRPRSVFQLSGAYCILYNHSS